MKGPRRSPGRPSVRLGSNRRMQRHLRWIGPVRRGAHAWLWRDGVATCARCGLTKPARPANAPGWIIVDDDVSAPFCPFTFIPKLLPYGPRSGWARLEREIARLRRKGMIGPFEEPEIVRGHARPWPGWKDRRVLREIQDRIQERERTLFLGVPIDERGLLRSDAPPLTYEGLLELMRAIDRQYPRTLPIAAWLEPPRLDLDEPPDRIEFKVHSIGWGLDVLKPKKEEPQT